MTREERLKWLKQIAKDIHVCSLESTLADDMKSCAIHSAIEELEQEPLFCENCGITEMQPMFGQRYCRYCGGKMLQKNAILERTNKLIEENKRYERAFKLAKKNLNEAMMTTARCNGKSVRNGWLYGMSLVVDTFEKYMKGNENDETNNGN